MESIRKFDQIMTNLSKETGDSRGIYPGALYDYIAKKYPRLNLEIRFQENQSPLLYESFDEFYYLLPKLNILCLSLNKHWLGLFLEDGKIVIKLEGSFQGEELGKTMIDSVERLSATPFIGNIKILKKQIPFFGYQIRVESNFDFIGCLEQRVGKERQLRISGQRAMVDA